MTLFGRGFRPFFLLAATQVCVAVPWWLAVFAGVLPAPSWLTPSLWHAHEMVFGFAAAAAAGFLLTAAPTWTSSIPLAGAPLAGLAALWLAGRLAMALAAALPLGRIAEPEEIAELAGYLLGPAGSFIQGSIYYIDGGSDAQVRPDRF